MSTLLKYKCLFVAAMAILLWQTEGYSQNLNYETVKVKHRQVPRQPLGEGVQSYSSKLSAVDLELSRTQLESMRSKNLTIVGYTLKEEEADVSIELLVDALSFNSRDIIDNSKTKKVDDKEVTVPAFQYGLNYEYPYKLKVTNNISGEVLYEEEDLMPISMTYPQKSSMSSTTELANAYETNKASLIKSIRKEGVNKLLRSARYVINDNFGYPLIEHSIEIGYVKKFKKHDYSDLYSAFEKMRLGLNQLEEDWYMQAAGSNTLKEALDAFATIKEEYAPGDKKARINEKIVFLINHNAAICDFFIKNFSECEQYLAGIGNKASYRIESNKKYLQEFIEDLEQRYTANNIQYF